MTGKEQQDRMRDLRYKILATEKELLLRIPEASAWDFLGNKPERSPLYDVSQLRKGRDELIQLLRVIGEMRCTDDVSPTP